ncbi:MAG TPA: BON domain-containing protein [Actinomycetota bacterium]|nr:BON domain-containing protein [Actinomycetota bacterium]
MSCSEYDAARLCDALARDERTGELGIDVSITAGKVFLHGKVATADRREAIAEVAAEFLPECTVVNEVTVTELGDPNLEILP